MYPKIQEGVGFVDYIITKGYLCHKQKNSLPFYFFTSPIKVM